MSRIVIDGRIDDWPAGLTKYPIRNRLTTHDAYDPGTGRDALDPHAYFLAGYNRDDGLIYLAVVVKDANLVVGHKSPLDTDAVEIYIDGRRSDHSESEPRPTKSQNVLDASRMPVLQYVGLPGLGPIYGTEEKRNPVLLYGKTSDTATKMGYRRVGDVITYEWAIQAFDRYPAQPTRLTPGKRLGLEVAVVDKAPGKTRPSFTTWGPPPRSFKGFDSGQLGELILDDAP